MLNENAENKETQIMYSTCMPLTFMKAFFQTYMYNVAKVLQNTTSKNMINLKSTRPTSLASWKHKKW